MDQALITQVFNLPADQAWQAIFDFLHETFSPPIRADVVDAITTERDKSIEKLDNVLSGSAWELWQQFEGAAPRTSDQLKRFWAERCNGKAILILDALSLRELPWLIEQAAQRGYSLHKSCVTAAEIPANTNPFAKALGFGQRSGLEHNSTKSSHFPDAWTEATDMPFVDCVSLIKADPNILFWHHWPDSQMHDLSDNGDGYRKLSKSAAEQLASDDFWQFVDRLATGRRLVITSDHGYAHSGIFPDVVHKDQSDFLKENFKSGRSVQSLTNANSHYWIPPLTQTITSQHGEWHLVLGRKKWKSQGGYPTLTHGGLSLLEMAVPFIVIEK
ncbi:hypothetical protein ACH5Y9_01205 [Methylomonas sp. BW4-1]|uniref:hypothetical protein n=1 Tax=Methylomonas sp. BW4-1 TaxID=3376685 RepID=UPI004041E210